MPAKRHAASNAAAPTVPSQAQPASSASSTGSSPGAATPTMSTAGPSPSSSTPTPTSAQTTTTKSLSSGPSTLKANSSPVEIAHHVWRQYLATTPQRTLLLDAFMAFLVLVGGVQFVYCVLAGNYPFNAFLSGFSAAVGQFVLTASLRMQTSATAASSTAAESNVVKGSKVGSKGKNVKTAAAAAAAASEDGQDQSLSRVSDERAFADFLFGSLILHFFCINFIN